MTEHARDRPDRRVDPILLAICALALGVRLIDVNQPFLDLQAWRQADTAAVARNFYEEGYDILHPRIDWRGNTPGYVEMEFPLFQFLVACIYPLVGGPREWVGHTAAALFSVGTIPFLYSLAREFCGVSAARLAAFVFAVAPLGVFFGRAYMIDPAMLFFSVGAIYYFNQWSAGGPGWSFIAAAVLSALAFLVKIPSLYLGLPLLFLAWDRFGKATFRQPALWAYAALTLVPTFLWYHHGYRLFEQTHLTYGIWNRYGQPKWGNLDLLASGGFYLLIFERLAGVVFTPLGFTLVIVGMLMKVSSRRERVFHVWFFAVVIYVLIAAEGNRLHDYYQLTFIPVGAVFAGKALARLSDGPGLPGLRSPTQRRIVLAVLLAALGILGYVYAAPLFAAQPYYIAQYEIGHQIDSLIPPNALLVVGDLDDNAGAPYRCQSPTLLYFAHRKGWQIMPDEFRDPDRLKKLVQDGAQFFLVPQFLAYLVNEGHMSMVLQDADGNVIRRFEEHRKR